MGHSAGCDVIGPLSPSNCLSKTKRARPLLAVHTVGVAVQWRVLHNMNFSGLHPRLSGRLVRLGLQPPPWSKPDFSCFCDNATFFQNEAADAMNWKCLFFSTGSDLSRP